MFLQNNFKFIKSNLGYKKKIKKQLYSKEIKKNFYKTLVNNNKIKTKSKYFFWKKIYKNNNIYFTKINNICILSGYTKSVYKKYNLNRMFLKNLINKGYFPGVIKASW